MRIDELLTLVETKIDFSLQGTPIYKNPSAKDTELLLKKFLHNSARFLVDITDGPVWLWEAGNVIHYDVNKYLLNNDGRDVEVDGFSFSGVWDHNGKKAYSVWSDSMIDETDFLYLKKIPLVARMFGNNLTVWDEDAGVEHWGL